MKLGILHNPVKNYCWRSVCYHIGWVKKKSWHCTVYLYICWGRSSPNFFLMGRMGKSTLGVYIPIKTKFPAKVGWLFPTSGVDRPWHTMCFVYIDSNWPFDPRSLEVTFSPLKGSRFQHPKKGTKIPCKVCLLSRLWIPILYFLKSSRKVCLSNSWF